MKKSKLPPKRRKRWIEKDASIKRIVVNFRQYENRVLEYLDELADCRVVIGYINIIYV